MKIIIATGGTGGHIYPALALANEIVKKDSEAKILFIGNNDRMEAKLIPECGYEFYGVNASGLTGNILNKAKAVIQMFIAKNKCKNKIKEVGADIAIGFGGYVSAPVILAAQSLSIPTLIHEQNSIVGASNKLVAKKATGIIICYELCYEQFPKNKTRLLGNPRASEINNINFDKDYYKSLELAPNKPLILIVMGSLGSTSINNIMKEALKSIDTKYQILYVSGKKNYIKVKEEIKQSNVKVVDYVETLKIIDKVELIICRAGATTAAEISAKGTPAILIPSPYVANNHQFYNANVLVEKKAALMIEEKDLTSEQLSSKIDNVMSNDKLRKEMKTNMLKLGYPNANTEIINWIEEICGKEI
ncbi:MAG: undecaprenyldiphospho-muramoylpentapeptide beta-N-acetylglucosaminyltransferase [Erysipelotrichaceae bacterium]